MLCSESEGQTDVGVSMNEPTAQTVRSAAFVSGAVIVSSAGKTDRTSCSKSTSRSSMTELRLSSSADRSATSSQEKPWRYVDQAASKSESAEETAFNDDFNLLQISVH